ncbi:MAG: DUF5320 domain-containing protein [Polyangiaceae bacterium]|nr:DUF5320 domain-containing protein [Polyangiaceae bacterium]
MPRGDRTGPGGLGPLSGREAGLCAGYPAPGFLNAGWGRGQGRGYGGGGGWRHRHGGRTAAGPGWQPGWMRASDHAPPFGAPFGPTMTRERELVALKSQAEHLAQALEDVRIRIRDLESSAETSKT